MKIAQIETQSNTAVSPTRNAVVQRVGDFIDKHYADGINLAHVARALNYSPIHLTTLVRKKTGRSVTAWIIERRLLAARQLPIATGRANESMSSPWRTHTIAQGADFSACPTCGMHRAIAAS